MSAHFHDDSALEVQHGLMSGSTFCFREENEGAEWDREGERRGGGARAGEQVGAGGLGMEGPLGRNCIVGFRAEVRGCKDKGPDNGVPGKEVCGISAARNEATQSCFPLLQTQWIQIGSRESVLFPFAHEGTEAGTG